MYAISIIIWNIYTNQVRSTLQTNDGGEWLLKRLFLSNNKQHYKIMFTFFNINKFFIFNIELNTGFSRGFSYLAEIEQNNYYRTSHQCLFVLIFMIYELVLYLNVGNMCRAGARLFAATSKIFWSPY